METMRRLVRLSCAAEQLGVKPSTLRDWFLKRKHLDFVKAGRAVCVTEDSIERFIAANILPAREAKQWNR
jgi:excisionase family DNA binding protein